MGSVEDWVVARDFRPVDRDMPMLLPPDLRDWLPEDHLAWLVIEVLGCCDLSGVEASFKRGGAGREAYDPRMLTALLVYGYCQGVRSSRAVERACVSDVAFRVIAAQQRPDHSTLSRFRKDQAAGLADLFGQVLMVCAGQGMGRVGVVAIDGARIAANASPQRSYLPKTLRKLAAEIVADAGEVDAAEDAEFGPDVAGDELPVGLRAGSDRAARIRNALGQAEVEERARRQADVETAHRRLVNAQAAQQRERVRAADRATGGRSLTPVGELAVVRRVDERAEQAAAAAREAEEGRGPQASRPAPRRNTTDPDSRLMASRGKGYVQGFNAQLVVSDDHLIIATEVTNQPSDRGQFVTMMQRAIDSAAAHLDGATVDLVLADAGYCSKEALTAAGPDRLIATGRDPAKHGRSAPIQAMAERLSDPHPDRLRYRRRAATVEPVIGMLKDRVGLRRFSRRGIQAARDELKLAAAAYNIRRLATLTA